MGLKVTKQEFNELVAKTGATVGPSVQLPREQSQAEEPREVKMVHPSINVLLGNRLVIIVPFATKSETNLRDWKARSRRSGAAWSAVRNTVGPNLRILEHYARAYHNDLALKVTFTRLGGRTMDRSNLPAAMKGVEDALAYILGASDGSPQWHSFFEQEPGGEVGVRIEVEIYQ